MWRIAPSIKTGGRLVGVRGWRREKQGDSVRRA